MGIFTGSYKNDGVSGEFDGLTYLHSREMLKVGYFIFQYYFENIYLYFYEIFNNIKIFLYQIYFLRFSDKNLDYIHLDQINYKQLMLQFWDLIVLF